MHRPRISCLFLLLLLPPPPRLWRASFLFLLLLLSPENFAASPIHERADRFLALANSGYQALFRVNSEAQWTAVTDVTPEHDAAAGATANANDAINGNTSIIT